MKILGVESEGSFKKYVRSEGGRGYLKRRTKMHKGREGLFVERTYTHVIFKR